MHTHNGEGIALSYSRSLINKCKRNEQNRKLLQ